MTLRVSRNDSLIGLALSSALLLGCHESETPAEIADVLYEGGATDEALEALLEGVVKDDPAEAAIFTWPADGEKLLKSNPVSFCVRLGPAEGAGASVAPGDVRLGAVSELEDRSRPHLRKCTQSHFPLPGDDIEHQRRAVYRPSDGAVPFRILRRPGLGCLRNFGRPQRFGKPCRQDCNKGRLWSLSGTGISQQQVLALCQALCGRHRRSSVHCNAPDRRAFLEDGHDRVADGPAKDQSGPVLEFGGRALRDHQVGIVGTACKRLVPHVEERQLDEDCAGPSRLDEV
jgi:hypothetical protein